jgi:hypothetical protein
MISATWAQARRTFARELPHDLERRLDELVRKGRECACHHGELRAIVARLRRLAMEGE